MKTHGQKGAWTHQSDGLSGEFLANLFSFLFCFLTEQLWTEDENFSIQMEKYSPQFGYVDAACAAAAAAPAQGGWHHL